MKKQKRTKDQKPPMPIPPWPGGGPRPPLPPGARLGGDLVLSPEDWKKINDIAANPEKYLNDEDDFRDECGLK